MATVTLVAVVVVLAAYIMIRHRRLKATGK